MVAAMRVAATDRYERRVRRKAVCRDGRGTPAATRRKLARPFENDERALGSARRGGISDRFCGLPTASSAPRVTYPQAVIPRMGREAGIRSRVQVFGG